MPRAHRLPPITVSHEQVFHAYTSPPIPEKGAPPTIIVTPAEPVSVQDFQILFVSLTPSRSTFFKPYSQLSKFFSHLPGSSPYNEAKVARDPIGLDISTRGPKDKRPIVAYNGCEPYSPICINEYSAIRLPEDEEEFDNEDVFVAKRKKTRWNAMKKSRIILCLTLPILLVLLHLASAWMGFGLGIGIGFGAPERATHHDHDDIFRADLWEWTPTHAVATDDLRVANTLTAGGVVPEMEVATTTLDVKGTPVLIENNTPDS